VGESITTVAAAVFRDPPPPIPGVPEALQTVILRCLRKEPEERYPEAGALLHELRAARIALDGHPG
jgi:hypothetical protein